MEKEELIATIQGLAHFMRMDANTFLWAKTQENFDMEKKRVSNTAYDIGGGNFMIALSALSFISLLAKIYKIISSEDPSDLFNKRGNFQDETAAVKEFVEQVNSEIPIIDAYENMEGFWRLTRHGLAHCCLPKGGMSTISAIGHLDFKDGKPNFDSYVETLCQVKKAPISKNTRGGCDCNADLLSVRAYQSGQWLVNYLSNYGNYDNDQSGCISRLFEP